MVKTLKQQLKKHNMNNHCPNCKADLPPNHPLNKEECCENCQKEEWLKKYHMEFNFNV